MISKVRTPILADKTDAQPFLKETRFRYSWAISCAFIHCEKPPAPISNLPLSLLRECHLGTWGPGLSTRQHPRSLPGEQSFQERSPREPSHQPSPVRWCLCSGLPTQRTTAAKSKSCSHGSGARSTKNPDAGRATLSEARYEGGPPPASIQRHSAVSTDIFLIKGNIQVK